jgi:hypothetical protein
MLLEEFGAQVCQAVKYWSNTGRMGVRRAGLPRCLGLVSRPSMSVKYWSNTGRRHRRNAAGGVVRQAGEDQLHATGINAGPTQVNIAWNWSNTGQIMDGPVQDELTVKSRGTGQILVK